MDGMSALFLNMVADGCSWDCYALPTKQPALQYNSHDFLSQCGNQPMQVDGSLPDGILPQIHNHIVVYMRQQTTLRGRKCGRNGGERLHRLDDRQRRPRQTTLWLRKQGRKEGVRQRPVRLPLSSIVFRNVHLLRNKVDEL